MLRHLTFLLVIYTLTIQGDALKCLECTGPVGSDCAKGVQSAGVPVKCTMDPPITPIPPVNDDLVSSNCLPVYVPEPACVTYSNVLYNAVETGMQMVYRSCILSSKDFCKSHLMYHEGAICRSCNETDYCF